MKTFLDPVSNEIVVPSSISQMIVSKGDELEVTACAPEEFGAANSALIGWCEKKISVLQKDEQELRDAYVEAVKHKWKSSTLKRHAELAGKRVEFYGKLKSALEHGFIIVPNFPVEVFAVRTNRDKPNPKTHIGRWIDINKC